MSLSPSRSTRRSTVNVCKSLSAPPERNHPCFRPSKAADLSDAEDEPEVPRMVPGDVMASRAAIATHRASRAFLEGTEDPSTVTAYGTRRMTVVERKQQAEARRATMVGSSRRSTTAPAATPRDDDEEEDSELGLLSPGMMPMRRNHPRRLADNYEALSNGSSSTAFSSPDYSPRSALKKPDSPSFSGSASTRRTVVVVPTAGFREPQGSTLDSSPGSPTSLGPLMSPGSPGSQTPLGSPCFPGSPGSAGSRGFPSPPDSPTFPGSPASASSSTKSFAALTGYRMSSPGGASGYSSASSPTSRASAKSGSFAKEPSRTRRMLSLGRVGSAAADKFGEILDGRTHTPGRDSASSVLSSRSTPASPGRPPRPDLSQPRTEQPAQGPQWYDALGPTLLDGDHSISTAAYVGGRRYTALYFGALMSPPCIEFSRVLRAVAPQLEGMGIGLIFVSADRTRKRFLEHLQTLPLKAVPWRPGLHTIQEAYGRMGVPTLVVLHPNGSVATLEGATYILGDPTLEHLEVAILENPPQRVDLPDQSPRSQASRREQIKDSCSLM